MFIVFVQSDLTVDALDSVIRPVTLPTTSPTPPTTTPP